MPKNVPSADQGRVKFRVIEFEVEGANATLVESIRNLGAAITRGNGVALPARSVQQPNPPLLLQNRPASDVDAESDGDDVIENDIPAAARKSTPPRKPPSLKPIPGIDWSAPAPSLKDFVIDLDLDSAMRKYTAIANWFKEHRNSLLSPWTTSTAPTRRLDGTTPEVRV